MTRLNLEQRLELEELNTAIMRVMADAVHAHDRLIKLYPECNVPAKALVIAADYLSGARNLIGAEMAYYDNSCMRQQIGAIGGSSPLHTPTP